MKRIILAVTLLGLLVSIVAVVMPRADSAGRELKRRIGETRYHELGLAKLSSMEQDRLCRLLLTETGQDMMGVSAYRYMEREGWRPIRVVGVDVFDTTYGKREILTVIDRYETIHLRLFDIAELPYPGWYWGKNTLSSWRILYPDGDEVGFSQEKR